MNTKRCSLFLNVSKILSTQIKKSTHTQNLDWHRVVSEAEKVVGYPTSFLNLRWLLSDEIANVAMHLRQLMGTKHPLLDTASDIIHHGKNTKQDWGLIVLLIAKAAGQQIDIPGQVKICGILHTQRVLAELTEMMRMGHLVHKCLVNSTEIKPDWRYGNKIALLSGDYLLSKTCAQIATLKNQDVGELMSTALRDLTESEFLGPRDKENNPLPAKPSNKKVDFDMFNHSNLDPFPVQAALGNAEAEWTVRNLLNSASLLGKACEATLKLAKQPLDKQFEGYRFGVHLALACQAHRDVTLFNGDCLEQFSLVSAPVLYELQENPDLYQEIEKGEDDVSLVNYELLYETVLKGSGIDSARDLQKKHSQAALDILENFPRSDARSALNDMITAM